MSANLKSPLFSELPSAMEASFRLLVEQSPGGVLLFDGGGKLRWFNTAAAQWLPEGGAAALGSPRAALFPDWQLDDSGPIRACLSDAAGERRWAQLRLQPLLSAQPERADGPLVFLLIDAIAAPVRHSATLQEVEDHLETALRVSSAGVWQIQVSDWSSSFSDGYFGLLGVAPATGRATADFWQSRVHPDDQQAVQDAFLDYVAGRAEVFEMEYRLRHEDGRWLWMLGRGKAVSTDAAGRPARIIGFVMDITARHIAENALRQSEERFRAVAELSPGYVFESAVQPDGSNAITYISDGFERMMGCTEPEFVAGGGWQRFCDADSWQRLQAAYAGPNGGAGKDLELHGVNPRAQELWLHFKSLPVLDRCSGLRTGSIGAVYDVTEAKRADLALRESQLVLQTITAGSATQLALFDLERRCQFVNHSLHGVAVEDMIGKRIEEYLPPPHNETSVHTFNAVLNTGVGHDTVEVIEFPGSAPRSFEIRVRAVRSAERIVGFVTNITDVTAQRQQQDHLLLQSRIIDTIREGVMLMDRGSGILLTNPAMDSMFGYERGTLQGRHSSVLSALNEVAFERLHQRVLAGVDEGEAPVLELEGRRPDGSRLTAACIFAGIEIGGQQRIVAVISDITERKQLEREVLHVATREQQRIGSDLHDGLGQQLTGIALMLKGMVPRLVKAGTADVLSEFERIISLVNDAIDSTRSLARGLSPVSADRDGLVMGLEALIAQMCKLYSVRIVFDCTVPEGQEFDDNTANHLYRIAQEALANAVRHGAATHVSIQLGVEAGQVDLVVHDDGSGFDRRSSRPTGLGLKIMRFRAQMIGGDLSVESAQDGSGTTIRCQCPLPSALPT